MNPAGNLSPQTTIVSTQPGPDSAPVETLHTKHINSLDGVRGLACLLILWVHAAHDGPKEIQNALGSLYKVSDIGWIGVDLFFVLSGFLITGILREMKGKPNYFKNFYMRRSLRIFPLYYASLIFWFLLVSPLRLVIHSGATPVLDQLWNNQLWYWFYVQNWAPFVGIDMTLSGKLLAPYWSLAIEEQFYLIWPLLIFLIPQKRLPMLCVAFIFISVASRIWLMSAGYDPGILYVLTTSHLDGFAIGGIVALYFRQVQESKKIYVVALSTLIASFLFVVLVYLKEGGYDKSSQLVCIVGYTVTALGFAALIYLCTQQGSIFDRVFNWKILRLVGKYSYAMYLFHWPFFKVTDVIWTRKIGTNILWQVIYFPLVVALLLGLARISWIIIEQPFLKLKSKFA